MTTEEALEDGEPCGPKRWSWLWLVGVAVNAVGNTARLVESVADEVSLSIARHDAWADARRDFADDVRQDIEGLLSVQDRAT